ncbi:uncharacterized protein LOC128952589 [Oppia nitens]|uniref:uncharacterized protein LOC128952589 n=1 Tax=Oppia nitens TaxID=1686743 RepID=UPI0023DBFF03|nr:uncharacterized protein LOC128952589 [Oppia nitens]
MDLFSFENEKRMYCENLNNDHFQQNDDQLNNCLLEYNGINGNKLRNYFLNLLQLAGNMKRVENNYELIAEIMNEIIDQPGNGLSSNCRYVNLSICEQISRPGL